MPRTKHPLLILCSLLALFALLSACQTTPGLRADGDGEVAGAQLLAGEELSLHSIGVDAFQQILNEPDSKWLLVNVWATWCVACKEEFPDLLRLNEEYSLKGLKTVLLSADFEDEREDVLEFLLEQKVSFPTYIAQGEEHEFIEAMNPKWKGTLPATQIRNSKGEVLFFKEGSVSFEELEAVLLRRGE